VALVLQIPSLWETGGGFACSSSRAISRPQPRHWGDLRSISSMSYSNGSFLDVTRTKLWEGQLARIWWTIESGGTRR